MNYKDEQEISVDFPQNMKDKQIENEIRKYFNEIIQSDAQENTMIQCYPLISLGQYELQKRQNRRITKISMGIAAVSLLIAIIALYISFQGRNSSSRWENAQIVELKAIEQKLDGIHSASKDVILELKKLQKGYIIEHMKKKQ